MGPKGWFVAGTDTGVGKTLVARALLTAAGHVERRVVGMKPIASGCRDTEEGWRNEDAELLCRASTIAVPYDEMNPYAFGPAISPHLAAREAGAEIRIDNLFAGFSRLAMQSDLVVVEGAGGWFAPISDTQTMADVARAFGLPVVLVVGMRLGCLNHALLTQEAIARSGVPFAGWVANCIDPRMERLDANVATLDRRLGAPRIARVSFAPNELPFALVETLEKWMVHAD